MTPLDIEVFKGGTRLPHDLLVAFPPYAAAAPFPNLPSDDRGFIAGNARFIATIARNEASTHPLPAATICGFLAADDLRAPQPEQGSEGRAPATYGTWR